MSEEEKRTKKQKIEDNRRLRAMSQSLSILSTPSIIPDDKYFQYSYENVNETSDDEDSNDFKYCLNNSERIFLTKIEEHYTQAVRLNNSVIKGFDTPCLRSLNDFVDVVNEAAHICSLRLITFFKLTPEFNVSCTFSIGSEAARRGESRRKGVFLKMGESAEKRYIFTQNRRKIYIYLLPKSETI